MWRRPVLVVGLLALTAGLLPGSGAVADAGTRPLPALSIRTDHAHYDYGSTIRLSVHLGSSGSNRRVSIVERIAGRSRVIDANDTVDSHGELTGRISAARNAVYSVRFIGSDTYAPRVASARGVTVAAAVTAVLGGRYATNGRYALVHAGRSARYDLGVAPGKTDQHVNVRVESWYQHAWRTVQNRQATLNGSSVDGISFTARRGLYRVRAEYRGDSINGGRRGAWSYLTMT